MTPKQIKQKARKMALAHVNQERKEVGMEPLRHHSALWWKMYGKEWEDKVKQQ